MKHILAIILLLNISLFSKDSNYSIIIDKKFNNELLDINQNHDRTLSAVGFIQNFNTASDTKSYSNAFDYLQNVSNSHGTQMQLIKVDNGGNILIDKHSALSDFSKAIALVKTPADGYYVGGHTMDGELILLKLDSNANTIFKKKFGTKNFDQLNNIVALSDGGVLAVGSSTTSRSPHDALFNKGLGLNDIFITRFSKDGEELWSKKYGTSYDDAGIDAIEALDGSLIVLGNTTYANNRHVTMMRLGQNGSKIWLNEYKTTTLISPHKIIKLRDGNFLVSISYMDELNKEQIRMIKFDLQHNVLIDKTIYTTYPSALKDIKEFADGTIVGVGYVQDSYNTDALVMLLDSTLNLLQQTHLGQENYDILNSVTIMHNSQIACAGTYTYNDSQESKMWILKLNKDLSIAQKASNSIDLYEKLKNLFAFEIKNSQIKISKNLEISLIDEKLYFKNGVYDLSDEQKKFLEMFSSKLIPFLHKHHNVINTLEVNGHTSKEWGKSDFDESYLKNAKLSFNRSYATMSQIFRSSNNDEQKFLIEIFKGSGLSYSKNIVINNIEDNTRSRRVTFNIILRNPH